MRWLGQPVMSAPLKRICPQRAFSMPAMVRIRLDLPAPLAPMMATSSPASDRQRHVVERLRVAVEDVELFDLEHHNASSPR